MSKNDILIITDKIDCDWLSIALKNLNNSYNYDILSLRINGNISYYKYKKKYSQLPSFKIINDDIDFDKSQEKIRKFIPSLIYELPRKKINNKSLFDTFRFLDINLWWFMEISEKGALRTPFIKTIYYLELIDNALSKKKYKEVWIELENIDLLNLLIKNSDKIPKIKIIHQTNYKKDNNLFWIKLLMNIYKVQLKCFINKLLLKVIGFQNKIPNKSILFFSFFPVFWLKTKTNNFFEIFFKSLPNEISKESSIRYAVWFVFKNNFFIWKNRKEIKKFLNQDTIIMESYLTLNDFIYIFIFSIRYIIKVLDYFIKIKPRIEEYYDKYNISNIVIDEINRSLFSQEVFNCMLIMQSIKNITKKNIISALIYRSEFQPHERAIEYGAINKCMTIALQLQPISYNHLQYFFAKNEIYQYYDEDKSDNLPLPNKFLLAGNHSFKIFEKNCFCKKDMDICGPIRYSKLIKYQKKHKTKFELRKKYNLINNKFIFLVACPSVKEEMLNLIFILVQSINKNDEFIFLFKSHPVYKFNKEIINIINEFCPNMNYLFLDDDINLHEYIILSDAIILTATTIGVESISLGTIPIFIENGTTFYLNPLIGIKDSCLSIKNHHELRNSLLSIVNNEKKIIEMKKNYPNITKKIFYNIEDDPNKRVCDILKKYGAV